MSKTVHTIYILIMTLIVIATTIYLGYTGYSFYILPLEERFYHPRYDWFNPAGVMGHGIGIIGTLMILFGVVIYIVRKRYNFLSRYIRLKYLLEFHIFLCTLGPVLIVFHTSFKIGGIVSIAFWSMIAVVLSGVVGRFIYIQIPRTIEGRELGLNEVKEMKENLYNSLAGDARIEQHTLSLISEAGKHDSTSITAYFKRKSTLSKVGRGLKKLKVEPKERKRILSSIKEEISLTQKINRLQTMQKLFKYWHVAHLPFALIMLIIVLIHVVVTLAFGYKWIF